MIETGDIRIDKIMPRLKDSWLQLPFEECLVPTETGYRKLKQKEIKASGRIPVVDQGEDLITGYTDEEADKYAGDLPIIIFGDHTRRIKYIDFQFAVGADGTKLLRPIEDLNPRFFFYYLCALRIEPQGYSRHYRFLKEVKVPIPSLAEQRYVVNRLEWFLRRVKSCQLRLSKVAAMLLSNGSEARAATAQYQLDRLSQSILAKAFRGELVPTDAELLKSGQAAIDAKARA